MPFQRPSLPTIVTRIQQDISAALPGTDPTLRRSMLGALGKANAGAFHGNYGYLNWIAQQIPPNATVTDSPILLGWCAMMDVFPEQPTFGGGIFPASGVNGSDIPNGTVLQDGNGNLYTSTADVQIAGGTANVPLTANEPGSFANLPIGATLTFVSPLPGVNDSGQLAAAFTGGADLETTASVFNRFLATLRNSGAAGNANDYVLWTLEQPNVTRAWCIGNGLGLGTVLVLFVNDNQVGSILPAAPQIASVQAALVALAAVTVGAPDPDTGLPNLTAAAPTLQGFNWSMHIDLMPGFDLATVKANVQASLNGLLNAPLNSEGNPCGAPSGKVLLTDMDEAIKTAGGVANYNNLLINGIAAADVVIGATSIPASTGWAWT